MTNERPIRRSLESLKKEAKRWLDALEGADPDAHARFHRALPNAPASPTLRDVQHALAREHGFEGWTMLKDVVEQRQSATTSDGAKALALYETKAEALLDAYRSGTPEAMERHYSFTWHRRTWPVMRRYVQLDLGKRPANPDDDVEITLEDARHLIALEHGFANWRDLRAFTESGKAGVRVAAKPLRLFVGNAPDEWHPIASVREWDDIIRLLKEHPSAGLSGEGQMTDALLAEVCKVETLTAIGLGGSREVTDDGLRHLVKLPMLQYLDLSGTSITDAGLQVVRHLPRLRMISLAGTRVTDEGARALAHCDDLVDVNLSCTAAGDGALRALAKTPKLRKLAISLSDAGLPLLHELPVFKSPGQNRPDWLLGRKSPPNHLSLRGSFTDNGMRHLRGLDGLYSLDIDDARLAITAAGLEPLVSLQSLTALSLDAKDDWMPHIAAMACLRFLGIQDTVAGDDGFAALSESKSIEAIWGRRCHNLHTRGFLALANMPALRNLSVSCLNVEDAGIAALPEFPALRELMPMDVPDDGYRHIGKCEKLESLVLMYCRDTTDAATERITGLRNLIHYFNSYTTITDRTPELLSAMDSLERITFDVCHGLTNAGIARLARLPKLRELRASGKQVTPDVGSAFRSGVEVHVERG